MTSKLSYKKGDVISQYDRVLAKCRLSVYPSLTLCGT